MPHTYRCGAFDCGESAINAALRGDLLTSIREGRSRSYFIEEDGVCLGFISLRAESFDLSDSIDREEYALSARHVPGVLLELLAVDKKGQGRGVGEWLLLAAGELARRSGELIGVRFLVLDSLPERVRFYQKRGFRRTMYQPDSKTVFMALDLRPSFFAQSEAIRKDQETYIRQQVLNDKERATFTGLKYYAADEHYVFRLQPQLASEPQRVELPTSRGETRHFLQAGTVTVPLPEEEVVLTLYAAAADTGLEYLFIPFQDATSGRETYRLGRSLNVTREGDYLVLDFNRASNLYCAYGDRWNCALPPPENHLAISVPVGEKLYYQNNH